MTSPEIEASADARASDDAPRIRGLSPADAIAVALIAMPVGVLLVAALPLVYGLFRVTRRLPMSERALAMMAALVAPLARRGRAGQARILIDAPQRARQAALLNRKQTSVKAALSEALDYASRST